MRDLLELTKPKITRLVVITTAVGFYLGSAHEVDVTLLLVTLLGSALVASGTNALNQWWERDVDAKMLRTRGRPLPSGRVTPNTAFIFASASGIAGIVLLTLTVNTLTASIAALTLLSYVLVYTPLKRRTLHATLIGSVPGALPILGGWTAATGGVDPGAWVLFGILFLWQMPHFLALAWLYRDDYARGGLAILSVFDRDGRRTGANALVYALLLIPVSILPALMRMTAWPYVLGAVALSGLLVISALTLLLRPSPIRARRLFLASIAYLPLLLLLMVMAKTPA